MRAKWSILLGIFAGMLLFGSCLTIYLLLENGDKSRGKSYLSKTTDLVINL